MKKARIVLGLLVMLAVAGGSFAFKAKTYLGKYYCSAAKTTEFSTQRYTATTNGEILFCSTTYTLPVEAEEAQIEVSQNQ